MKVIRESTRGKLREVGAAPCPTPPVDNETDCWTTFVHDHLTTMKGLLDCLLEHIEGSQE